MLTYSMFGTFHDSTEHDDESCEYIVCSTTVTNTLNLMLNISMRFLSPVFVFMYTLYYAVCDYPNLQQLTGEVSSSRDAACISAIVSALAQHIIVSWRKNIARAVTMKFT